eukprot:TRINITY_DN20026_c0_g2_i1.p1 TRINITY_DN20026_c0_g2~~TRINITY_DN20026_c0_g2_i1.p1  ORF type:complete len:617 (+),score=161.68 TRINITY_DN20026_c0_g2_i1:73-1851(+)
MERAAAMSREDLVAKLRAVSEENAALREELSTARLELERVREAQTHGAVAHCAWRLLHRARSGEAEGRGVASSDGSAAEAPPEPAPAPDPAPAPAPQPRHCQGQQAARLSPRPAVSPPTAPARHPSGTPKSSPSHCSPQRPFSPFAASPPPKIVRRRATSSPRSPVRPTALSAPRQPTTDLPEEAAQWTRSAPDGCHVDPAAGAAEAATPLSPDRGATTAPGSAMRKTQVTFATDSFVEDEGWSLSRPFQSGADMSAISALLEAVPAEVTDDAGKRWFRSTRMLGKGASGEVWLGMSQNGALCALKGVRPGGGGCDEELLREVSLLLRLQHPNIVRHLGNATLQHGHVVLAMEYISGGSLEGLLSLFGTLPPESVRRYAADILRGLAYLHGERVTHGDLKPANVLVQIDGRCKLCDFGAAAMMAARSQVAAPLPPQQPAPQNSSPSMRTAAKAILMGLRLRHFADAAGGQRMLVGTPVYMAPEACIRAAVMPSDIWSLGISIIHLLTGHLPYDLSDFEPNTLVWRLGRREILPFIPDQVLADPLSCEVVEACLRTEPQQRPSAQQLLRYRWVAPCEAAADPPSRRCSVSGNR